MEKQSNGWDHANRQGENRDFNKDGGDQDKYLQDGVNSSKDADGFDIESARSESTRSSSQMGSRSGNSETNSSGSRNYDSGGANSGSAGRAS